MFPLLIPEPLRLIIENPDIFLAQASQDTLKFLSAPSGTGFFVVRIFFIVVGLLLLAAVLYFLRKTTFLKFLILWDLVEFLTYRPYGVKSMRKFWDKIVQRLETGDVSEYKLAILEADDLVDSILKKMGYGGNNLEERLSLLSPVILPNIKAVEQAHRLRNSIVHDPDYHITLDEAKKTLEIYEKALRDLQALE